MTESVVNWLEQLFHLLSTTTQLSSWAYVLVFVGGLASALSPCYTPVLAMFAGYVGGYARETKGSAIRLGVPFVLGNLVKLAVVGALAAFVGRSILQLFTGYQLDRWIPGLIGLVMGLQLLGIIKLNLPAIGPFRRVKRPDAAWSSFVLGLPFGLVVTPCTIPIFFAIVTFVAFQASVIHGALLMITYALGRGLILLVVATTTGLVKSLHVRRLAWYLERISGGVILIASIGLLLFYDAFVRFTGQWTPMTH